MRYALAGTLLTLLIGISVVLAGRQTTDAPKDLDARVTAFLQQHRNDWHDLNVPEADGQQLYDLVLKNGYTRALEIGTSTGRSGIYIAWALAKNGGKLITIDIDEARHRQAVQNFKDAGVGAFVDARLGDAHDIVPKLDGPFDFVFSDADKDWYINYAKAVLPKLRVGGCVATHNVYGGRGRRGSNGDYYEFMTGLPYLENSLTPGGVLISYKRRDK
jgi:predicted O-methyltransferase YrrM